MLSPERQSELREPDEIAEGTANHVSSGEGPNRACSGPCAGESGPPEEDYISSDSKVNSNQLLALY
jgi:hypothetical protein